MTLRMPLMTEMLIYGAIALNVYSAYLSWHAQSDYKSLKKQY